MNILQEIAEKRLVAVEQAKRQCPEQQMRRMAEELADAEKKAQGGFTFPFYQNLKKSTDGRMNLICEIKKASPSKGIISEEFPYREKALEYEQAGAGAISVLTEPNYFLGKDEYLEEISAAVKIPTLRKDFLLDSYQIYEAKTLGASAVLLICSLLEAERLKDYLEIAHAIGLSALVEAHDESEVEKALTAGAQIVGVNNRNLKDFTVDINNSLRLRKLVPQDKVFVSESGIRTEEDIRVLSKAGVHAVLIGETVMRAGATGETLRRLAGAGCDKG